MVIEPLRLYLLAGLVLHKAVWEVLKSHKRRARVTTMVKLVKAVKIAILTGILAQTLVAEVLPISQDSVLLRGCGTFLFTAGLALAITARLQLGRSWSDIEVGSVADDQSIVDHGVYRLIRHPIYMGDILLVTGLELALNSWLVLAVPAIAAGVWWQAGREEEKLASYLPAYRTYQQRTKRFIPFVA
jgi:protein-S-isoprenylcysteine O-methyltransferase Ste14